MARSRRRAAPSRNGRTGTDPCHRDRRWLAHELRKSNLRCRIIVECCRVQHTSIESIAESVGACHTTVRSRLSELSRQGLYIGPDESGRFVVLEHPRGAVAIA